VELPHLPDDRALKGLLKPRAHPPARRAGAGRGDKSYRPAQSAGPEPLARRHHPRPADERHARALYQRAVGDGAHLESHHLRAGDQKQHCVRATIRQKLGQGRGRPKNCSSRLRSTISRAPQTCSGQSTIGPMAWTDAPRSGPTSPVGWGGVFVRSWNELMGVISSKSAALK
jgi:hypothetical protein